MTEERCFGRGGAPDAEPRGGAPDAERHGAFVLHDASCCCDLRLLLSTPLYADGTLFFYALKCLSLHLDQSAHI